MASKAYVVTDLGSGDGGKGSVVHAVATAMHAHTVIKRGGTQGSHGVRTSGGEKFDFSQWGCGTLEGIQTFLSDQMVISPAALLPEALQLRYQLGIYEPFALLAADERALCATPFHGIASRLKELARRDNPRGTVGTGVGETYRSFRRQPELAIFARDLRDPGLLDRLAAVREHVRTEIASVIGGGFLASDETEAIHNIRLLRDDSYLAVVAERFAAAAAQLRVVGNDYLGEAVLRRNGVVVVESSHGVLTDRLAGFHPHTSAIRTLPRFTHGMLTDNGCDNIVTIGVTRAYAVRHGAGPLPTADPAMADRLLPERHEDDNRYQGEVRVGPLDLVMLRYAINACGGPSAINGLAVTCLDQVRADGAWRTCNRYDGADDPALFSPDGEIIVDNDANQGHLEHQAALREALLEVTPVVDVQPMDVGTSDGAYHDVCAAVMERSLGIPVRMTSFGPTELDKLYR